MHYKLEKIKHGQLSELYAILGLMMDCVPAKHKTETIRMKQWGAQLELQTLYRFSQSRKRLLIEPSPGWKSMWCEIGMPTQSLQGTGGFKNLC